MTKLSAFLWGVCVAAVGALFAIVIPTSHMTTEPFPGAVIVLYALFGVVIMSAMAAIAAND